MYNNDINSCWFYQMCKRQCSKDVACIFGGIVIVLLMLLLFRWIISTFQIILIVVGGFLVISGLSAFFKKLPKVKAFLRSMPPEWFATLGQYAPMCRFGTFYPTEYYLCIPSEYIMIRYCDIVGMVVSNTMYNGSQTGITLKMSLTTQQQELSIVVDKWVEFQTEGNEFMKFIEEKKAAMLAPAGGGKDLV